MEPEPPGTGSAMAVLPGKVAVSERIMPAEVDLLSCIGS